MLAERSSPSSLPVGHLTRLQYVLTVSARLKGTPTCLLIYLLLILLNVFVIAYEYNGGSTRHWLAIIVETVINLVLVAEVATSILQQRSAYCQHTINLVDLLLTLLCLLFFVLFLINPPSSTDDHYSEIDIAILITRYVFQLTRISVLIYRGRKTTDALTQDDIDFTVHEMRDRIDAELSDAASTSSSSDHAAGGGGAVKGGPVHSKSQAQLEKQQLLRGAGEEDHSQGGDEQWRRKERRDVALAGLELQLKRNHSRVDDEEEEEVEEEESKGKGGKRLVVSNGRDAVMQSGPMKRAVSPGNREVGSAGGVERKKGLNVLATSLSDLTLSRSARRVEEEPEDEDELVEDELV